MDREALKLLCYTSALRCFRLRHDPRDGHEAHQQARYWAARYRRMIAADALPD